jgi:hypothetical protein
MKGHLYQPLAKKPQSAFRQKPLNDLQNQSSRRFMPSLWNGCENFSLFAVRHSLKIECFTLIDASVVPVKKTGSVQVCFPPLYHCDGRMWGNVLPLFLPGRDS